MLFQYVCKDVALTGSMKEACEEKLAKFNRYFRSESEVGCVVTVQIRNRKKVVEVALHSADGVDLRAVAKDDDFYNAVDETVEKLEGQMRKVKTQLAKAKKANAFSQGLHLDDVAEVEEPLEIIRKKSLTLTPMDADEALARMDALGHSFFIYLDSSTGLVNVLYERDDHGYGVIEIEK